MTLQEHLIDQYYIKSDHILERSRSRQAARKEINTAMGKLVDALDREDGWSKALVKAEAMMMKLEEADLRSPDQEVA